MAEPKHYPECEKLAEVAPQSQIIGEFLEWLSVTKEISFVDRRIRYDTTESLLAEFFDIDMEKVEKERSQMIADLRKN